jgi:hypothetical protein
MAIFFKEKESIVSNYEFYSNDGISIESFIYIT